MPDRLYLSCKLRGVTASNMLRHYHRLLAAVPYSRLATVGGLLRVNAVSEVEPPVYEASFDPPVDPDAILKHAREFTASDCAVQFETAWDLWQYEQDWEVAPSRMTVSCFGPDYEDSDGDHLRISFGLDSLFIPDTTLPNGLFMARSNIRSLLHFAEQLDKTLTLESRRLWSESGENFAERLQAALHEDPPAPELGPRLVQ
ncbi:MAG TPA: hypothetical protein VEQ63_08140 [Bryobacteraceae bacterium]|nr:hypothetical protein [Bryobacteraceae bacterium]